MFKMSSQLENIIAAYQTLTKIPSVSAGRLNNAGRQVTAKWSVRNLDKGKSTKYVSAYTLDDNLNVVAESDFGTDVSNELLSAISPRETFKALIREEKNGKELKKQYLEVWNKNTLAHCVDLTALDIHGDVYADSEFSSLDWSHDETSLVYVAERKLEKSEPYIKRKVEEKPKIDGSGEIMIKKGEEYVYKQDWGEQLGGKHLSVIVVCKLPEETFTVLEGLPESWCPGQVRFNPEGTGVVGVAWATEPRRLGLIFCTNRPSYIFSLSLDGTIIKKLSGKGLAVRSPRYSPRGDLLWLQRTRDGPHHACHQLAVIKKGAPNYKKKTEVTIITDIVQTSTGTENGHEFHGLYCQALPSKCFSADGRRVVLSTSQKNEVRAYVIDIDTGKIVDISNKRAPGSTSVLDTRADVIIACYSNMTTPGQVIVARLPPAGSEGDIKWLSVSSPNAAPASFASSTVQYMELQHDTQDTVKSFNAIYFAPKADDGKKLPLIVWPHGGPHSNFVNGFSLEAALFNMLGFATLQINYRGSTGQGEATVTCLLNKVGDYDVKDCKLATDEVVKSHNVDERKLGLFGGSHGGFLVTHLSGQYPETYSAVVSRNPVTDIASMFNSTDIADWCAVEAGYTFTEAGPISEEQLLAMRRCSPLAHVHKVRAPTALMLGAADKRVPHFQGLEYARRLKANNVPTRIYMYDDNHSLSSAPVEMDNLINSAHWFMEHLNL
ncbi:acylamino-acid-releasing enzyme-like isoform X1 [Anticarsia gemmatalis]|uniref:acylamino-acid-releasing enzyme-like isoform X1 n=1 Tax=Anticarsia gemmatalis TaxID=129554 RepID=UPI003F75811D